MKKKYKQKAEILVIPFYIPGFDKEDILTKVSEDFVEVHANKKIKTLDIRGGQEFYRKLHLIKKVIPEKTMTEYENDIFEITLTIFQDKNGKENTSEKNEEPKDAYAGFRYVADKE